MYLCYFAAADVEQVGAALAASQEAFDVWFKAQMAETAEPNWGGRNPSEILADFST